MTEQIIQLSTILESNDLIADFRQWSFQIADYIYKARSDTKLTTIFGNGGSAADSQHWAAELMCTYKSKIRKPFPVVALTTDSSLLTAWSNDFDFSSIFSRQIESFGPINGLSIGMSTSGKSINVLEALSTAKTYGARTILISGSSISVIPEFDLHVRLPSSDTPIIQSLTQMLYHEVCQNLEDQ